MARASETDVREMLRRRAGDFVMAPAPSDVMLRRGARRKARNAVLASATAVAMVAVVAGVVTYLGGSDRVADSPAGGRTADRALGPPSATIGRLRLVDYVVRPPSQPTDHAHADSGPRITIDDARRHAACMRSQGFDVPGPTATPGGGWSVIVEDPERRGLTFRSRAFRQAWFVICGPLGGPLSGDLVIGGPRSKVDRFISCMSGQGFRLPEPSKHSSRGYDGDEWRFDLTRTGIDTSTRRWNQAMFVACAPEDL
jgi:hypothetical protein